jgi:hypothetical protein
MMLLASGAYAQQRPVFYDYATGQLITITNNVANTNANFGSFNVSTITATNGNFTNASVIVNATTDLQVVNFRTLTNKLMHPYIALSCTNTLTSGGANLTNIVPYTDIDLSYMMTTNSTNEIKILRAGTYRIFPSVIASPSLPNKHVKVWIQQNGTNVPRSAMRINIANATEEQMLSEEVFLSCVSNDLIKIAWGSIDDANMQLVTTTTTMGPIAPAVIVVMEEISD